MATWADARIHLRTRARLSGRRSRTTPPRVVPPVAARRRRDRDPVQPGRPAGRGQAGAEPERRVRAPVDDRVGERTRRGRASAARRLVPGSGARLVEVPSLPEPPARPDGVARAGGRQRTSALVDVVPGDGALADRRVRGRPAPRMGPVDLRDRRRRLPPDRERSHARLRVGELRLARLRNLDPALGDVAAALRVGAVVASDRQGQIVLARRARARADRGVSPADGVPRAAVPGCVRAREVGRAPATDRPCRAGRAREPVRRRVGGRSAARGPAVDRQR